MRCSCSVAYYFLEGVPKKIIRRESGIGKRGIRDVIELTEHLMLDEVLHKQQADGLLGGYGRVACVDATLAELVSSEELVIRVQLQRQPAPSRPWLPCSDSRMQVRTALEVLRQVVEENVAARLALAASLL